MAGSEQQLTVAQTVKPTGRHRHAVLPGLAGLAASRRRA